MPAQTVAGPTRHGKTRIYVLINEEVYKVRYIKRDLWSVTHNGDPGRSYLAGRPLRGDYGCTCPDRLKRGAWCKHLGALLALHLVSRPRRKVVAGA
jgi:hypothetical protein